MARLKTSGNKQASASLLVVRWILSYWTGSKLSLINREICKSSQENLITHQSNSATKDVPTPQEAR